MTSVPEPMSGWSLQTELDSPGESARLHRALARHGDLFDARAPLVAARAPGRLDLMGGIADYSGSLVLQLPLAVAALAVAQPSVDRRIVVRSTLGDDARELAWPLDRLAPGGRWLGYDEARRLLTRDSISAWGAYVIGAFVVLAHERAATFDRGARILIDSAVPSGKGVSSSAAIEVASMQAVCAAYGLPPLEGRALALLCQRVENLVVGAPCGIMDQMTSACGERGVLLALRCQPAELEPGVAMPDDIELWGIDSGVRHAVGGTAQQGADYGSVRIGAFMGYRMLADLSGAPVHRTGAVRVTIDDVTWHGYLANVTPSEWETHYRERIPETIAGADFLSRYGGTTDPVTRIDGSRVYAVRAPTAHPIHEHARVRLYRALLQGAGERGGTSPEIGALLGELMFQSHASYSACGLGSPGTDRIVALVRERAHEGLLGAKITGGGSGGTVAVLARRGARDAIETVARDYEREAGRRATVLGGSSDGAVHTGVRTLTPV